MADKDPFQRYFEAGIAFTNMTRAKAEEMVQELVKNGEFQGKDVRAKVDEVIERSRKARDVLVDQVRTEVSKQLDAAGVHSLEDLAKQVATLLQRGANDEGPAPAGGPAPEKAAAKQAAARKAAVKKAAPKKAAAKKAAAKKAATNLRPGSSG